MSPSVARGLINLQYLRIEECSSMEEVITKEEQQGEGSMTLFPLLEELNLLRLPKLGHFFLTEHALQFSFLRNVEISNCLEMKTFVQQRISMSTPSLESVNNDDDVKVVDLNKTMFNSKVSCPNLKELSICRLESITALCSHQLPTAYFSTLETLYVLSCDNLRNLMSPTVARGALNIRSIEIDNCLSMEEVITEEEQQGKDIMTLFPLLEMLELKELPKLRHFFLTKRVTAFPFPFLREVRIGDCPEMKTFFQHGISVSTPSLESVNNADEVKVVDLNKAMFNSKQIIIVIVIFSYSYFCLPPDIYVDGGFLSQLGRANHLELESISALCSHQLPTAYFSKLETLEVSNCRNLRNLMSPTVARGALNLRRIRIYNCVSMEEVITEEEQQGEEIKTLFPLLEKLKLKELPKLRHFFLTKRVTEFLFPFLREVRIGDCPEMKTFIQHGISVSTPSLESVNNDDEVKVVDDLNKTMFNSKVSCPNLEELIIWKLESINSLCSHQLPTAYFSKLETLEVSNCGNIRNLMSLSVARGALNIRSIQIDYCASMEEVITEEEQQGDEIMTLFPLLEMLELKQLPRLRHFFLTKHVTEFPFLREVRIGDCPEMQTFVQHGIFVSTPSLESVNNDDEVKVVDDLNKAMFNSKVSCPNLEELIIWKLERINALCSHQLPTAYFSKLETLEVSNCGNIRNLMSLSVARGALNIRSLQIDYCASMEEVITEEEQQGDEIMTLFPLLEMLELKELPKLRHFFLTKHVTEFPFLREVRIVIAKEEQQGERIMTLFPQLKDLSLNNLPKLGHFFLAEHTLKFPFLREVWIDECPQMKTFVQQGISVSTPSLECLNDDYEVKVDDFNKWTQQRFKSKEQKASQGTINGDESEAIVGDKSEASDDYER
ncbi:hypothetical protein H5410_062411, partial [Solanum commersonii]